MGATGKAMVDVAIAGGSYAGLALALALRRTVGPELEIAVLDRQPLAETVETPEDPRAFALAAGSCHLLEAIGVWETLAPYAQPVTAIDITDSALDNAVRPVLLSYDNVVGDEAQMHIVEAWRLGTALREAIRADRSIAVLAPAEVVDLSLGTGIGRIGLGDGRSVQARLVVAADGARSRLRELAGIGATRHSYEQMGLVAVVGHERPHGARAVQHFLPGGPFAILPMRGNRSCLTWSEKAEIAREIMASGPAAFLAEAQRRAGWKLGELSLERGPRAWPLEGVVARRMTCGRLVLVGDAARSVHPIAGQGFNLALRDVGALVEVASEGLRLGLDAGDATIVERYQRWRGFDSVQSSAAFGLLNGLFTIDWAPARALRGVGLGLVDRLPGLKSVLVAEAAGQAGEVPRLLRGEIP